MHVGAGVRPRKLRSSPAHITAPPLKEHPVVIFFEALLVLVAVGVLAFAGLAVKKLYQGQR
ncbi:hypothetical protein GCM10027073_28300 [Streptomyces chlorus]